MSTKLTPAATGRNDKKASLLSDWQQRQQQQQHRRLESDSSTMTAQGRDDVDNKNKKEQPVAASTISIPMSPSAPSLRDVSNVVAVSANSERRETIQQHAQEEEQQRLKLSLHRIKRRLLLERVWKSQRRALLQRCLVEQGDNDKDNNDENENQRHPSVSRSSSSSSLSSSTGCTSNE
mmetsp:Transcript_23650/g.43950  ORF Transcript_23650/g.43950 Transcript_23650/m.43950 type:complete len:178 (+) Transcript_23650:209-742(+)